MSKENAYQFMEKAYNDEGLQKELQSQTSLDAVVVRASEAGYDFTAQELQETAPRFYEDHGVELSEDQLEDAAGGGVVVATFVKNAA